jgi:hypothetical protein
MIFENSSRAEEVLRFVVAETRVVRGDGLSQKTIA